MRSSVQIRRLPRELTRTRASDWDGNTHLTPSGDAQRTETLRICVKSFTEALQRMQPIGPALSLASAVADANGELTMMKTLITTTVLALGLGLLSTPSFASGYVVNGHAASPAEAQVLVASGVQQGAWVVNGYGIAPAERASFTPPATEPSGKKCYYALLCD
jgi:hypothetical protein